MNSIAKLLHVPYALVGLFLRLVAAHPFFLSGQTKVDGPTIGGTFLGLDLSATLPKSIKDSAIELFAQEYKLPLISPEYAAYAAAVLENLLPLLLVLGLATRVSALLLLIMTLIIQIFVYPDAWWTVHAYWAAILLVLVSQGAGGISLDYVLSRLFALLRRRPEPRRAEAPADGAQL
jgi:putative oxidoreductase